MFWSQTNPHAQKSVRLTLFLWIKSGIPIAYIETKDIGKSLTDKSYKEQFDRYKSGLDVLIITDYMEFVLYYRGVEKQRVFLANLNKTACHCEDARLRGTKQSNLWGFSTLLN